MYYLGIYCEYKVRYVRNITDVVSSIVTTEDGEDKNSKSKTNSTVLVSNYNDRFLKDILKYLIFLPPSIEPTATDTLLNRRIIKKIVDSGIGYEANDQHIHVVKF
jgi:cysteinyl-tRNA synthetase